MKDQGAARFLALLAAASLWPAASVHASAAAKATTQARPRIFGGIRIAPTGHAAITGRLLTDAQDGWLRVRNARGRVFNIDLADAGADFKRLLPGTKITVWGIVVQEIVRAVSISVDDELYGSRAYHESHMPPPSRPTTVTGTLIAAADAYGFDLIDARGKIYSVLSARLGAGRGGAMLRAGHRVRVFGDLSVVDNVPQLDASNLVRLGGAG